MLLSHVCGPSAYATPCCLLSIRYIYQNSKLTQSLRMHFPILVSAVQLQQSTPIQKPALSALLSTPQFSKHIFSLLVNCIQQPIAVFITRMLNRGSLSKVTLSSIPVPAVRSMENGSLNQIWTNSISHKINTHSRSG